MADDQGDALSADVTASQKREEPGMTTATRPDVHQFGLIFEDNAWPLLYVRFPSKPLSDEGFEYFIERYTDVVVECRIPFATILDSRGLTTAITANQRKRLTEWFEVTGDARR